MIEIAGSYAVAGVFTDVIEESAKKQIMELCNQPYASGSVIRIMPDVHTGAGCTIGTTMTIKDKVIPNLVGVDIGCGMLVHKLSIRQKDRNLYKALDEIIHRHIPSGFDIRKKKHRFSEKIELGRLHCEKYVDLRRAEHSVATLGGGNHFIELDHDENTGSIYLVIHTGSRHLGKQIAEYYQTKAAHERPEIKNSSLAYLQGKSFHEYLDDMSLAQSYAEQNRYAIADVILSELGIESSDSFSTVHNYIDLESMILRKGAVSAKQNKTLLIPISMSEGCIIATGRGNPDWNMSAPHGAGRLMSRTQAKKVISLDDFKKSMKHVYSTSVTKETIDEAPSAYRSMDEIISKIQDTVIIKCIIRPLFSFKADGD